MSVHHNGRWRASRCALLVLLTTLLFYGAIAVSWARRFPSPTLPVDAYFGFDPA